MTIIKNHFEVFLVTSKKQGNGIIESKVGLYSIKPVHTYLSVKCQSWPRFRVRNSSYVYFHCTSVNFIFTFHYFLELHLIFDMNKLSFWRLEFFTFTWKHLFIPT
jgi:hypothetical protein